jgi:hypothetical protein
MFPKALQSTHRFVTLTTRPILGFLVIRMPQGNPCLTEFPRELLGQWNLELRKAQLSAVYAVQHTTRTRTTRVKRLAVYAELAREVENNQTADRLDGIRL